MYVCMYFMQPYILGCGYVGVVVRMSEFFLDPPLIRRIHHDTSKSFPQFQINEDKIESTDDIKYLGLKIDPSLHWKERITTITRKIP